MTADAAIHLGRDGAAKAAVVARYAAAHGIARVVVVGPARHRFDLPAGLPHEHVDWPDVIRYVVYYRLLREIDRATLVVANEPLRTQDRHDLSYNCLRLYLQQTPHALVFSRLPLIDGPEDAMILFDFATQSRWKRAPYDPALVRREVAVAVADPLAVPALRAIEVRADAATRARYAAERARLFAELGAEGDPHAIPRQLHLLGGRARLAAVPAGRAVMARNRRFGKGARPVATYGDDALPDAPYVAVDLPHRFLDFADFLTRTGQRGVDVAVTDLKVDRWYFDRYRAWAGRIADVTAAVVRA